MTIPNREPDFIFPDVWRFDAPELWRWVQEHALHVQQSFYSMTHEVWMPIQDERAEADE